MELKIWLSIETKIIPEAIYKAMTDLLCDSTSIFRTYDTNQPARKQIVETLKRPTIKLIKNADEIKSGI